MTVVPPFVTNMLACKGCNEFFDLAAATSKSDVEALSETFEATCPHCYKKDTYTKLDIQPVGMA